MNVFRKLSLWKIEDNGPILRGDLALLRGRPRNVADDVHPPSGGTGTGNKPRSAQGLITGCGCNVIGANLEVVDLVCEHGLQKNKHTVVPGTIFILSPAKGALFGKAYRVLVASLDNFPGSENRFCDTVEGGREGSKVKSETHPKPL